MVRYILFGGYYRRPAPINMAYGLLTAAASVYKIDGKGKESGRVEQRGNQPRKTL